MRELGGDPDGGGWTSVTFAAKADAAGQARRALPLLLADAHLQRESFSTLELLVSELVTNAVTHSGADTVDLRVRLGDPIRVCVVDSGSGSPHVTAAGIGGWGLRLVDALSLDWGVLRLSPGKAVWFDVATDGSEQPAP